MLGIEVLPLLQSLSNGLSCNPNALGLVRSFFLGFSVTCCTHMVDPSTLSEACASVFRSFGFPKIVGHDPFGPQVRALSILGNALSKLVRCFTVQACASVFRCHGLPKIDSGCDPFGFSVFCWTHRIDPSTLSIACTLVFLSFGFPKIVGHHHLGNEVKALSIP